MNKSQDIGVIIARFQVPSLHSGHRYLIETVSSKHETTVVLLGTRDAVASAHDPLDFPTRKMMLEKSYPKLLVLALPDSKTNSQWSETLDTILRNQFGETNAILYGSRDSFIPYYEGIHTTVAIVEIEASSGTQERIKVAQKPLASQSFRRGMIYGASNRFPTSFQTVDIAILNEDRTKVLLGQKTIDGEKYRFVGGFVDPTDSSLEFAAKREAREEVGFIEIGNPIYLGSYRIEDFRYRKADDGIMTALFVAPFIFGAPHAHDDLSSVKWINLSTLLGVVVPEHRALAERLLAYTTNQS